MDACGKHKKPPKPQMLSRHRRKGCVECRTAVQSLRRLLKRRRRHVTHPRIAYLHELLAVHVGGSDDGVRMLLDQPVLPGALHLAAQNHVGKQIRKIMLMRCSHPALEGELGTDTESSMLDISRNDSLELSAPCRNSALLILLILVLQQTRYVESH